MISTWLEVSAKPLWYFQKDIILKRQARPTLVFRSLWDQTKTYLGGIGYLFSGEKVDYQSE
jgi:hypothetical protein